jgi:sulfur carrier protein
MAGKDMMNDSAALELIEIIVNGEPATVAAELTVDHLLSHLELPADRVAVELNKRIINKRDWSSTCVGPGARLEIVQFVGGG